jgi:CspA family cold shock protein
MQTGTVKWFNATKGYGFIQPSNKASDVFLHMSALEQAGLRAVNEGQKVSFETESKNGKTSAINIKLI